MADASSSIKLKEVSHSSFTVGDLIISVEEYKSVFSFLHQLTT